MLLDELLDELLAKAARLNLTIRRLLKRPSARLQAQDALVTQFGVLTRIRVNTREC